MKKIKIRRCNRKMDFVLQGIKIPIADLDENDLAKHFASMAAPVFASVLKKYHLTPGDSINLSYQINVLQEATE